MNLAELIAQLQDMREAHSGLLAEDRAALDAAIRILAAMVRRCAENEPAEDAE